MWRKGGTRFSESCGGAIGTQEDSMVLCLFPVFFSLGPYCYMWSRGGNGHAYNYRTKFKGLIGEKSQEWITSSLCHGYCSLL